MTFIRSVCIVRLHQQIFFASAQHNVRKIQIEFIFFKLPVVETSGKFMLDETQDS